MSQPLPGLCVSAPSAGGPPASLLFMNHRSTAFKPIQLAWWVACALLPTLAGCSQLPTQVQLSQVVATDTGTAPSAVRLASAAGPLSAAQSQAVLARLSSRGQPTDIFQRHLAIEDALVGSPLTTGNQALLLQDGPATYRAMLAAIEQAKDHINLETYILDDDAVGQRFARALLAKQNQGVQVHLMHDSVGTLGTPAAFFKALTDQGIQVLEFNPVDPSKGEGDWRLNQRNHRKLLIVDGQTAILGGINISSVYSGGSIGRLFGGTGKRAGGAAPTGWADAPGSAVPADRAGQAGEAPATPTLWRDTDLQLQGPVVAELQKLFLSAWASQNGPPVTQRNFFPPQQAKGQQLVRAIGSSPQDPFSLIYATLLSAINSAETSIHITNAYFAPDPLLLSALEGAAQRGVAVQLILPKHSDSWLVFHAGRSHYSRLLRAGVKLHERRDVILHAKTALVDGVWSTVGSTNLDWRSFLHNHELNAVVLGADFGGQMQTMFERDLTVSDPVLLAPWEDRSLGLRLKEWLARLWEYWL